jgi:hypothetical protein
MDKQDIKHLVAITLECKCTGGSPAEAFRLLIDQLPKQLVSGDVTLEDFSIAEAHYIRSLEGGQTR